MQWLIEVLGTSMDGYGVYVWPSFLICGVVMLGIAIVSARALRRANAKLTAIESGAHEA
jgi:heme exporter protein CcmD